MCLQFLSHDWNAEQRFQILKFYENAANNAPSSSLSMYLMSVTRDFARVALGRRRQGDLGTRCRVAERGVGSDL